jgi:hypothetical protein
MEQMLAYLRARYLLALCWPKGVTWPASRRDEVLNSMRPTGPVHPMCPVVFDE